MNSFKQRIQTMMLVAMCAWMAGAPVNVHAADLNIAQSPLVVATNVEPNVVFTLDDSGSMQWEMMPDPVSFAYLMPQASSPYGGNTYGRNIPRFNDNYRWNLRSRNPQLNSVFYNPEITYEPWSRADGSLFPNADPDNALRNPTLPDRGAIDLDSEATWNNWSGPGPNDTGRNNEFWPITFYMYDGTGDINSPNNYRKYQIREDRAYTAYPANASMEPLSEFTWPGGIVRTVEQEKQNFANWFTYHRSRVLTSRAAIGKAFTEMPDQARVGFAAINKGSSNVDGVNTRALITGVRNFNLAGRQSFYDRLYEHVVSTNGTPLRRAAEAIGEYFERTDSRGPWSTTPGSSGGEDLACRQSFHILMSDGFWNGNSPGVGNADGSSGPTITGPDLGQGPQSFTYAAVNPFADNLSNTLADVAMHYWKRDLRPDIENMVSTTPEDPAFWQHLTSFGIALGLPANAPGSVDPEQAFAAIETQTPIDWGNPYSDAIAKVNDLLHFGLNGRGGFFTADRPDEFAAQLGALLVEIVSRSTATTGLSVSSTRLTQDSLVFAAEFDSADWSGELKAINVETGNTEWEAASKLDATAPGSRKIVTSERDGTGEEPFTTAMDPLLKVKIHLNPAQADRIINYVRGEDVSGFRARATRLGDIVNSRPVFMGPSNEGWTRLPSSAGGSSYRAFVDSKETRDKAVFVGANDGMLHAFNAENGSELFGFVPRAVFSKLEALTRDPYDHRFYVDGQIVVRDAFSGSWRRVLVGTLGAGGRGVYAIDVTDPGSPDVLWELTADEDPDIGFTFGDPVITRLGSGKWVAMFGNGYNSDDNNAVLFVVDLFNGNVIDKIVLESQSDSNGLSGVAPLLDPETRLYTSRVYAGDLLGNVWRVDFSSGGGASVAFGGDPLFTDPDNRPITATPGLAASPAGGLFVYVGTGKLIEPEDRLTESVEMDRMYALRDQESPLPNNPDFGHPTITNTSEGRVLTGDVGDDGWVLDLSASSTPTGERVLSRPRIIFGQVIFTTFEPSANPCSPGGEQRLYVVDALSGGGALDNICQNCGVISIGIGAPIDPPVLIIPPGDPAPGGGSGDPGASPFDPPDPSDPPPAIGAVSGWCSQFATLNPATGQPLVIGTICDGRQVWRQVNP